MFFNYDTFHYARKCTFITGSIRYGIIGIIDEGLRFIYNHVKMISIVKCISMYILFGHECKQSLCEGERARCSRDNGARASLPSKEVFQIFTKME